jgi:carbon monoxide dehydrogenase subunit G
MSLKIEETFRLEAPIDRVWDYLSDPRQVVNCLPGAELTSIENETTFLGKVKVKVGPVTAAYAGRVTITERDDVAHVVRLVGDGRESSGGGSAKMTMTSTLAALPTGGTEVRVTADLDVVGRLMQFGRGMIESVNKQMFKQFTDCLRMTLETEPVSPTVDTTFETLETTIETTIERSSDSGYNGASTRSATARPPVRGVGGKEPVRLLPVMLRALWENLVRVFRAIWRRYGE